MKAAKDRQQTGKKNRQRREVRLVVRLTSAEHAAIALAAEAANATASEYIRARALQHPPRPSAQAKGERRALILALGNLGAVATELHQAAQTLAGAELGPAALQPFYAALTDIAAMGTAVRNILLYGDHRQDADER